METIEISADYYIDLLEDRRREVNKVFGWEIPDAVWNYAMELIRDCGVDPRHSDPKYVVDNMAVNGSWGTFDELREDGESDSHLKRRLEEDAMAVLDDEEYVIFTLGL